MIWKSNFFSVWIMIMNKSTWGTRPDTRIPETEADRASRRNAGTAETVVIDRWQMVSLFETRRTSTEPAAKICNATTEEKQPTVTWLSNLLSSKRWGCEHCCTWNTNGVSSYVLANWREKERKRNTTHAFISLLASVAPILTASSPQLLPCHDHNRLRLKAKNKEERSSSSFPLQNV